MRLLLFTLFFFMTCTVADRRVLRQCFERYPNHRLVNVRPYHSEWRMKTEDSCLLFCAQTSSRCRSIGYDSVQHICHFFSEEGVDQAVISAKMIYLRVVAKNCLEDNINGAVDEAPVLIQTPTTTTTTTVIPSTEATTHPAPSTHPTLAPEATESAVDLSDADLIELQDELKKVDQQEIFEAFDDQQQDVPSAPDNQQLVGASEKKLEEYAKVAEPPRAVKPQGPPMIEISGDVEVPFNSRSPLNYPLKKKSDVTNGAKILKFDEDSAYRKASEIRRKPTTTQKPYLKPVTISSTSYIEKAKSFIDSLNEDDDREKVTTECDVNDVSVWVTFENSESATDENDGFRTNSRSECQRKCIEKNCRSYTFLEKRSRCIINTNNNGVQMKEPSSGPFSASLTTKFCYPSSFPTISESCNKCSESFTVLESCTNFVGFRDYTLATKPVEEFEGLPSGYEGLQLCMELCVLSNQFDCRSATFNIKNGTCQLLAEDSLSQPDDFRYSEDDSILYFENGCANDEKKESDDRRIEVITTTAPPQTSKTLKSISIKPAKSSSV